MGSFLATVEGGANPLSRLDEGADVQVMNRPDYEDDPEETCSQDPEEEGFKQKL